jgi:hypothetical protein
VLEKSINWGQDHLLECLLDVEEYSLPKVTKVRKARGPGMAEDRHIYMNTVHQPRLSFFVLCMTDSRPIRDETSREGKQFRLNYGVPRMFSKT